MKLPPGFDEEYHREWIRRNPIRSGVIESNITKNEFHPVEERKSLDQILAPGDRLQLFGDGSDPQRPQRPPLKHITASKASKEPVCSNPQCGCKTVGNFCSRCGSIIKPTERNTLLKKISAGIVQMLKMVVILLLAPIILLAMLYLVQSCTMENLNGR